MIITFNRIDAQCSSKEELLDWLRSRYSSVLNLSKLEEYINKRYIGDIACYNSSMKHFMSLMFCKKYRGIDICLEEYVPLIPNTFSPYTHTSLRITQRLLDYFGFYNSMTNLKKDYKKIGPYIDIGVEYTYRISKEMDITIRKGVAEVEIDKNARIVYFTVFRLNDKLIYSNYHHNYYFHSLEHHLCDVFGLPKMDNMNDIINELIARNL